MDLDKDIVFRAFNKLDEYLRSSKLDSVHLIVGGGASLILAYDFKDVTADTDFFSSTSIDVFKDEIDRVARDLQISSDWLNSNFSFFSHYLPQDYGSRLIRVFSGQSLKVDCLGSTDVLIMKFMALRQKDMNHISFLLAQSDTDLDIIEKRLDELADSPDNRIKACAERGLKAFDRITGRGP